MSSAMRQTLAARVAVQETPRHLRPADDLSPAGASHSIGSLRRSDARRVETDNPIPASRAPHSSSPPGSAAHVRRRPQNPQKSGSDSDWAATNTPRAPPDDASML